MSNKNIKISATRISSFLSCKQKYWFAYRERLPKLSNPSFKLGTTVHETLEHAGKMWLAKDAEVGPENNPGFSKEDLKIIMSEYDKLSVKEGIEDMAVRSEGKVLVKKRLADFISGNKLIGLETPFGFRGGVQISSKLGVPLIGAIDKVEEFDEDTLLIVDYKTSKTAPSPDQMKTDMQLSIYDMVARQLWPGYKRIILSLDLLKTEPLYTYRTDDQREEFEEYIKVVYDEMVAMEKKDAVPSLHSFCPWCDYKDYCKAYKDACTKSEYEFLPVFNMSNAEIINEWKEIKATKKILDLRDRELSMVLMEQIKKDAVDLKTDEEQVYIRQSSRKSYDTDIIAEIVPHDEFVKMASVNKKAVEAYMQLNPVDKERIEEAATVNFTTPFLSTKKLPKEKKDKKKT